MKQLSLIFTLFITLIVAMNTHAHTGLESSVPSDNAMLMESLEDIELRFSSAVSLIKLELINKADGQLVPIDFTPTTSAAAHFIQSLPALKIGTYQVNWTAMGSDGHKMEGSFSFMAHVESNGSAMAHPPKGEMHGEESNHSGH